MNCYNYFSTTGGGAASGTAGCYLATTGTGPTMLIGMFLLALTLIFGGVLLMQLARRGTRLPVIRRWFPTTATPPPVSPTS
jgi:hypothetical protein